MKLDPDVWTVWLKAWGAAAAIAYAKNSGFSVAAIREANKLAHAAELQRVKDTFTLQVQ